MAAAGPEDLHHLFAQAFNASDLDALTALYEGGASLIPEPDQLATGADAVRQALSGLLAMNPTITVATHRVVRAADIALLYSSWRLRGTGVEGGAVEMEGRGTEIARRRQADGRWLFVIDDPFSGA
jgi:ketosteroid isomerase-like protein